MPNHEREKLKLLQRVRRIRGQLDALERSLDADQDCGDQLLLLAAIRGGINGLMGEVLEDHIRFHLSHAAGGELEQIQFLLGHASVQTTERYIGCRQKFKDAVNDRFKISLPGLRDNPVYHVGDDTRRGGANLNKW